MKTNVGTKATSAGLDPKSQTIPSPCPQDSLCLGLDEDENVWQEGENEEPFTSSPPIELFVRRGVEDEEERM